jgi:hypothetical protein
MTSSMVIFSYIPFLFRRRNCSNADAGYETPQVNPGFTKGEEHVYDYAELPAPTKETDPPPLRTSASTNSSNAYHNFIDVRGATQGDVEYLEAVTTKNPAPLQTSPTEAGDLGGHAVECNDQSSLA